MNILFYFVQYLSDPALEEAENPSTTSSKLSELMLAVPVERTTGAAKEEWVHAAEQLVILLPGAGSAAQENDGTPSVFGLHLIVLSIILSY